MTYIGCNAGNIYELEGTCRSWLCQIQICDFRVVMYFLILRIMCLCDKRNLGTLSSSLFPIGLSSCILQWIESFVGLMNDIIIVWI